MQLLFLNARSQIWKHDKNRKCMKHKNGTSSVYVFSLSLSLPRCVCFSIWRLVYRMCCNEKRNVCLHGKERDAKNGSETENEHHFIESPPLHCDKVISRHTHTNEKYKQFFVVYNSFFVFFFVVIFRMRLLLLRVWRSCGIKHINNKIQMSQRGWLR